MAELGLEIIKIVTFSKVPFYGEVKKMKNCEKSKSLKITQNVSKSLKVSQ